MLRSDGVAHLDEYWPAFIFRNYAFDSRDPWSSLFRSSLLVIVSSHSVARFLWDVKSATPNRPLNIYLHLLELWEPRRWVSPSAPAFTAWSKSPCHPLHMLQLRWVFRFRHGVRALNFIERASISFRFTMPSRLLLCFQEWILQPNNFINPLGIYLNDFARTRSFATFLVGGTSEQIYVPVFHYSREELIERTRLHPQGKSSPPKSTNNLAPVVTFSFKPMLPVDSAFVRRELPSYSTWKSRWLSMVIIILLFVNWWSYIL